MSDSKGKLYEYALIHHPRPVKAKDGEPYPALPKSKFINGGVKQVIARDDKEVGMVAAREIPDEFMDKLDEVEIVIRPF
jgi:hypothetical protein